MAPSINMFALNAAHASMRINGEWFRCDDEVTRPVISALILGPDGQSYDEAFLIDTGSDRTVFRAALKDRLTLVTISTPPEFRLTGIGGTSASVLVAARLEFTRDDGQTARVGGYYSVFTDPVATDMSILGRDVLDTFDLIVSRQRDEVLLLSQNHRSQVVPV
jgi:hypothetical protein